jgi:hypothetical protein
VKAAPLYQALQPGAVISQDGKYRYKLARYWNSKEPPVIFIMLNPSTADAVENDPTIRRCISFAKRWGFGGLEVYNLFALRSYDPAVIEIAGDPVGPDNDNWLRGAIRGWRIHCRVCMRPESSPCDPEQRVFSASKVARTTEFVVRVPSGPHAAIVLIRLDR